jgi:hypothetical protein
MQKKLALQYVGDIRSTHAVLAAIAANPSVAAMIFDVVDKANAAGIEEAVQLAAAIRESALTIGIK